MAFLGLVLCLSATATPVKVQQILGDWEATQVLVTSGESNSQRFMNPDDANVVGRKYGFQLKTFTQILSVDECTMDTSQSGKAFPIKTLFAAEGLKRPSLVKDRFYGRMSQYELGDLKNAEVTIYAYKCKESDPSVRLNEMGNWFAAADDTIIWPFAPDALVILKRQPTEQTSEQSTFCKTAVLASDKVICNERELWSMKRYTELVRSCAIKHTPQRLGNIADKLDSYVLKRTACGDDRECIVHVLQEHVGRVSQFVRLTVECTTQSENQ